MAEMVGGGSGAKKGKGPKTKKKSTKIDMTAMVDVAFLLLTFFVLTATMSNSVMIKLTQPPKPKPDDPIDQTDLNVNEKKVMTMILCEKDTVRYYIGCLEPSCQATEIKIGKASEMRGAIEQHLKSFGNICGTPGAPAAPDCWDPIFVVKPRYNSRYANMVDILDEFAITGAKKYAIPPEGFSAADSTVFTAYQAKIKLTKTP